MESLDSCDYLLATLLLVQAIKRRPHATLLLFLSEVRIGTCFEC
jgi:hypothetical protein